MPLQPPKRTANGFSLSMTPVVQSPPVTLESGAWAPSDAWKMWAEEQRKTLIGELLSHGSWFSKPPRREVLESLFGSWTNSASGEYPETPADAKNGEAQWSLNSLTMTSTAIKPVWSVVGYKEDVDAIPFFDGDTVDSGDEREIKLEDIEPEVAAAPTQIRNREWETRKFMAKERVREARLKSQIANRMARAEEARYYRHFGDLEEDESQFSEYDLSDSESESEESESPTLT